MRRRSADAFEPARQIAWRQAAWLVGLLDRVALTSSAAVRLLTSIADRRCRSLSSPSLAPVATEAGGTPEERSVPRIASPNTLQTVAVSMSRDVIADGYIVAAASVYPIASQVVGATEQMHRC